MSTLYCPIKRVGEVARSFSSDGFSIVEVDAIGVKQSDLCLEDELLLLSAILLVAFSTISNMASLLACARVGIPHDAMGNPLSALPATISPAMLSSYLQWYNYYLERLSPLGNANANEA